MTTGAVSLNVCESDFVNIYRRAGCSDTLH